MNFGLVISVQSEFWASHRRTDRQTDTKRCIWTHRAKAQVCSKTFLEWLRAPRSLTVSRIIFLRGRAPGELDFLFQNSLKLNPNGMGHGLHSNWKAILSQLEFGNHDWSWLITKNYHVKWNVFHDFWWSDFMIFGDLAWNTSKSLKSFLTKCHQKSWKWDHQRSLKMFKLKWWIFMTFGDFWWLLMIIDDFSW